MYEDQQISIYIDKQSILGRYYRFNYTIHQILIIINFIILRTFLFEILEFKPSTANKVDKRG